MLITPAALFLTITMAHAASASYWDWDWFHPSHPKSTAKPTPTPTPTPTHTTPTPTPTSKATTPTSKATTPTSSSTTPTSKATTPTSSSTTPTSKSTTPTSKSTTPTSSKSTTPTSGSTAIAAVYTACTVPNTVAITFDDGPYIYQPEIMSALKQYNAKATFFVNGDNWSCIYDDDNIENLKLAYNAGHQIADHTWHHYDLATLTQAQLETEFDLTNQAIQRITGALPAFMRPPYGSYNNLVQQVAGSRGQKVVIWDFDSGDSVGATVQESEDDYTTVANKKPSTILALNHETYQTSAEEVLPFALKTLSAKGYKFVTVADCLGMAPYQSVGSPGTKDASWTC